MKLLTVSLVNLGIIARKFIAIFALSAPIHKQTRILSNIIQISRLTLRKSFPPCEKTADKLYIFSNCTTTTQ